MATQTSDTAFNKKVITEAMIEKISNEDPPKVIKTNLLDGFPSPDKLKLKGEENIFQPDLEVEYGNKTHLYSIETDGEPDRNKWRLFSLYARKHNGSFYLIVPRTRKENVKEYLNNEKIRAGVVYF